MEGDNKDKSKKTRDSFKDRFQSSYRAWRLKYQGTKVYKNIDSLTKFQQIYYDLINK
jgi:hypothetical protein